MAMVKFGFVIKSDYKYVTMSEDIPNPGVGKFELVNSILHACFWPVKSDAEEVINESRWDPCWRSIDKDSLIIKRVKFLEDTV